MIISEWTTTCIPLIRPHIPPTKGWGGPGLFFFLLEVIVKTWPHAPKVSNELPHVDWQEVVIHRPLYPAAKKKSPAESTPQC